jgi:hypothetical protein
VRQYSEEYSNAYHIALNGMVEKQMRLAIHAVSSFWYSAWIDAGQPDLRRFDQSSEALQSSEKEKEASFGEKIIGREL